MRSIQSTKDRDVKPSLADERKVVIYGFVLFFTKY